MSMARMICYFDYRGFLERMTSILQTLKAGNSNELRELAKEIAMNDPKAWKIADFCDFFPNGDDFEEKVRGGMDPRIVLWLVLIMSKYCSIIDNPLDAKTIGETIRPMGIDEETIDSLAIGSRFGSLFALVNQSILPEDFVFEEINNFPAGWLSLEEIQSIRAKLQAFPVPNESSAYKRLLTMLDTAIQLREGLLVGISV